MSTRTHNQTTSTETVSLKAIPDKMYFRIGEVAAIVGVKPYVLRYWESEFPALRPQKSRTRQRMYRRRDVELLLKIKHLLYNRRYTIAGARQMLKRNNGVAEPAAPGSAISPPPAALELVAAAPTPPAPEPSPSEVALSRPTSELDISSLQHEMGGQLQLNLQIPIALRDDIRRRLQEILSLCDELDDSDPDPLAELRGHPLQRGNGQQP